MYVIIIHYRIKSILFIMCLRLLMIQLAYLPLPHQPE